MRVAAAILAAGRGERFGGDKTAADLGGKPVWRWSYDVLRTVPRLDRIILVTAPDRVAEFRNGGHDLTVVAGGETRQESSFAGLSAADGADILLVHDAARPFLSNELVDRVLDAAIEHGAAAAAVKVTDTIKQVSEGAVTTLDRQHLFAMQTPQAARIDWLSDARFTASATDPAPEFTDEMAMIEATGRRPCLVEGDDANFKITTAADLDRARSHIQSMEIRTGFGYDVHAFSADLNRMLYLGGLAFPGHVALDGHSDADVLIHAAVDAILGAAALGDIGRLFPNSEPRWKGEPSTTFLRTVGELVRSAGWVIVNVDATVIAESPKITPRADDMRRLMAEVLGIEVDRMSIKATTNERLGFLGREEGIAAHAVATIRR